LLGNILLACLLFCFVTLRSHVFVLSAQISGLFSLGSTGSRDLDSSKKGRKSGGSVTDESSAIESPKSSLKASPQSKAVLSDGGPPEGSPQLPGYTREYDYNEADPNTSPSRDKNAAIMARGFNYEKDPCQSPLALNQPQENQSAGGRKVVGLAFNYAPGEDKKVAETAAEKRKTFNQQTPDPASLRQPIAEQLQQQQQGLSTPGFDYVESASRKEQSKMGKPVAVPIPGKLEKSKDEKPEKSSSEKPEKSSSEKPEKSSSEKPEKSSAGKSDRSSAASSLVAMLSRGKKNKDKKEKDKKKKDKKKKKKKDESSSSSSSSSSDSEDSMIEYAQGNETVRSTGDSVVMNTPKIFKTTTKQRMVQNAEGITQNIEEKVEDLTPGGTGAITVSNVINTVRRIISAR
jgi:hypothetical protein